MAPIGAIFVSMVLLRSLLWTAAKHVATNPALRRKAAEGVGRAKPAAKAAIREAKRAAAESPPLDDPGAFIRNLAGRTEKVTAAARRPVSKLDEDVEAEDLDPSEWRRVDDEPDDKPKH